MAEGITLEASLYGGAVFTLVYGSRNSTRDVDAIIRPTGVAKRLAATVAKELSLPDEWLSDDVRFFLAERESKRQLEDEPFGPGLRVSVPTAAYLLALKLRACRPPLPGYAGDYDDLRFLLKKMEIRSIDQAEAVFERFFPQDALTDYQRGVVTKLIQQAGQP